MKRICTVLSAPKQAPAYADGAAPMHVSAISPGQEAGKAR